ncbi:MAG: excinuclease ABC subunit UvrC, partial [Candidatus Sumerlaeaceae bacterium]|nr:excinuclease ABC subunit UvrC [Candidatus Sumerlaeaceae bacterium]
MTVRTFDSEQLENLPTGPGVYLMKNATGEIIYVGKALSLRSRVRSYFNAAGDGRFKVPIMRRHVVDIETIVTASEKEAFLLENTLIKQHRPKYNVLLRDDKTFISMRFRMNHDYPRLEQVRVRPDRPIARSDRDLYFGPYTSPWSVRQILRFVLKIFPVRTCKDSVFANRTRPCILYDVGKCCGPCVLPVAKADYAALVNNVALFLRGKNDEVRTLLEQRMAELSETMEFERAALVRDRIAALDETLEKQRAVKHERIDRDVVAIASESGKSLVIVQEYRGGLLLHSREFLIKNHDQTDEEVLYSFLSQRYDGGVIPHEIL